MPASHSNNPDTQVLLGFDWRIQPQPPTKRLCKDFLFRPSCSHALSVDTDIWPNANPDSEWGEICDYENFPELSNSLDAARRQAPIPNAWLIAIAIDHRN